MAINYKLLRTITVAGISADADPNLTPPTSDEIFHTSEGDQGHAVKFTFTDNSGVYKAGGTVDFTDWHKDADSGAYVESGAPVSAAAGNRIIDYNTPGNIFPQVTAVSAPSGGTKLQVWVASRKAV